MVAMSIRVPRKGANNELRVDFNSECKDEIKRTTTFMTASKGEQPWLPPVPNHHLPEDVCGFFLDVPNKMQTETPSRNACATRIPPPSGSPSPVKI